MSKEKKETVGARREQEREQDRGNGMTYDHVAKNSLKKKTLREALKFFDCRVSVQRQIQTSYKNHTTSLRVCTVWFCGS